MLTQSVPGFVSRDKERDLHLIYRSASQRAPTILPTQIFIPRANKAPDSLTTRPWISRCRSRLGSALCRYEGNTGGDRQQSALGRCG
jgi:hypothetical protein